MSGFGIVEISLCWLFLHVPRAYWRGKEKRSEPKKREGKERGGGGTGRHDERMRKETRGQALSLLDRAWQNWYALAPLERIRTNSN